MGLAREHKVSGAIVRGTPNISPLLAQTQSSCMHIVEYVSHVSEGTRGSVGLARAGLSGVVVCLLGLVGLEDFRFQVPLREPEVIL